MKDKLKRFTNFYTGYVALIFSFITSGYWILGSVFNVYTYKIMGAIYELLWILMVPLLFLVPIASIIGVVAYKFKNSYFYLISIMLSFGTFIWLKFYF